MFTEQNVYQLQKPYDKAQISFSVKYLLLILAISISGISMLSDHRVLEIAGLWGLCIVAILLCGVDLLHPYFCYSVGFCLYATAYPILCIINGNEYLLSKELLPLNWLAFSTFLLVVTPKKAVRVNAQRFMEEKQSDVVSRLYLLGIALFVFVVSYFLFFILLANVTTKMEYNYNFFAQIWRLAGTVLLFVYAMILMILLKKKNMCSDEKRSVALIVLLCGVALFLQGTIGERDCWFKFIGISIFCFYASGKLKNRHFAFVVPAIIAIMGLSVSYKYFFLAGRIHESDATLIQSFLKSDFAAASRNLEILIDGGLKNYFPPLSMLTNTLPSGTSISSWFTREYVGAGYGLGFTIVGVGYITLGLIGIILIMIIVALIAKYIYYKSGQSLNYFAAYIMFMLLLIYACRGTLSTVFINSASCVAIGLMLSVLLERNYTRPSIRALKEFVLGFVLYTITQAPDLIF